VGPALSLPARGGLTRHPHNLLFREGLFELDEGLPDNGITFRSLKERLIEVTDKRMSPVRAHFHARQGRFLCLALRALAELAS
jgi:hypothetical protein